MSGITPADRCLAWNIRILDNPRSNDCLAGTFQSPQRPFLTWKDFFDDIFLCFDLESSLADQSGALALWFRTKQDALINKFATPCVYFNYLESNDTLSRLITVGKRQSPDEVHDKDSNSDSDEDVPRTCLDLTPVVHNYRECVLAESELDHHLNKGCAMLIRLTRNPKTQYLPIPSSAGSLATPWIATPRTSAPSTLTPRTPSKRPCLDSPIDQPDLSPLTKCDDMPRAKFVVPSELELSAKKLYNGTCVVSRNNTSWGNMVAGPAIETCHIIPKAMYRWYPLQGEEPSEQDLWNAVNSTKNCMVMDSISHAIHDNRLLAVHPYSHRIRLFAPIKPLLNRNNRKAYFKVTAPSRVSLEWHYKQTVIENMCAFFLEQSGAKRMPWREGPASKKRGDRMNIEPQDLGPAPQRYNKELESSNFTSNAAQDIPHPFYDGAYSVSRVSQSTAADNHPPQYSSHSRKRGRSISASSADAKTRIAACFAEELSQRLRVEAQRQAIRERVLEWSKNSRSDRFKEARACDGSKSCSGASTPSW